MLAEELDSKAQRIINDPRKHWDWYKECRAYGVCSRNERSRE